MKPGRIIPGRCPENNSLELGKKASFRRNPSALFVYAYYSDNDSSAMDSLEMSVQFGVNGLICTIGSVSGLIGREFPGNTLRVDHSCSEKDVPFSSFLTHVPRWLQKVDLIHLSDWEMLCDFCPIIYLSLGNVSLMRQQSSVSTSGQAGCLRAARLMAVSSTCRNIHYSPYN